MAAPGAAKAELRFRHIFGMNPGVRAWTLPKTNLPVPSIGNRQAGSTAKLRTSRAAILTLPVLAAWLALVIFTASRHEFWRDEVRALTLARAADTPLDFYHLLRDDGHPALWYLMLYLGLSIVDSPLVLPIVSLSVAFAAVAVFMLFAPFPRWFRTLFIFTALPVFEYSVMARNYGISMLVFFLAALLYPARSTHPYRLAIALAVLANTNVHSTMLACLIAAAWAWDMAAVQRKWLVPSEYSRYRPIAIVAAGVLLSVAITMPRERNILTPAVHQSEALAAVPWAIRDAVLRPDLTFPDLLPSWLRPTPAVLLLYGAIAGLVMRPNLFLAALSAQLAFGVFFRLVYPGWYRHQGLYLLFLLFLYWVFVDTAGPRAWSGPRRWVFRAGLYGAVLALLLVQLSRAPRMVWDDITGARSASKEFGEYLAQSPPLRDAVIVPEPDFVMESLAYYAPNAIYLPREGRYGQTVSWTRASKASLTLGEVLRAARAVQQQTARPVLVVLAPIDLTGGGEQKYLYGKRFSWTAAEAEAFRRATTYLRDFEAPGTDEDYRVYLLR